MAYKGSPEEIRARRRAEEARRQQAARIAGFSSRAEQRRITAECIQWSLSHAGRPIAAFATYRKPPSGEPKLMYWQELRKSPGFDKTMTYAEYVRAYYDCFVNPRAGLNRFYRTGLQPFHTGDSGADWHVWRYFVDVMHYYAPTEYERRYGPLII